MAYRFKLIFLWIFVFTSMGIQGSSFRRVQADFLEEGSQANRNYIGNSGIDVNTKGWVAYDDAAAVPVDCTGGSADNILTAQTTVKLRGDKSLQYNIVASAAGEGFSYDFKLDQADALTAAPQTISFDFSLESPTKDQLRVYVYNVDTPSFISLTESIFRTDQGNFQASFLPKAGDDDYRLCIHRESSNVSVRDENYFDNFSIGPGQVVGSVAQAEVIVQARRATTNQTISTASPTTVIFNSANYDPYGTLNVSTGEMTMPKSGMVEVSTALLVNSVTTDSSGQYTAVRKNGTNQACDQYFSSSGSVAQVGASGCVFEVASGDIITVTTSSDSDSSYTINTTPASRVVIKMFPLSSDKVYAVGKTADVMGTVFYHAAATCPANSLAADGSAVSRTTYAELFAVIGTTFGAGNGSTTFNLPNLSGIFIRGTGSQAINGRTKSGPALGAKQEDQSQGHRHNGSQVNNWVGGVFDGTSASGITVGVSFVSAPQMRSTVPIDDGTNGTPRTGAETYPSNIGMKACIWNAHTPFPLVKNAVTTSSAGVDAFIRIRVASVCSSSPCTITSSNVPGVSITRAATGNYTLILPSGTCSEAPSCVVNGDTTGVNLLGSASWMTSTTGGQFFLTTPTTNATTDGRFNIVCGCAK